MDQKIGKYFCIFCENCIDFNTINDAYNHYKLHMNLSFYCINCDNNCTQKQLKNKKCDQNQSHSKSEKISSEEECLIEMWIERFLSYQNELIEKTFRDLLKGSKLFSGCPVCESFLRLCDYNRISYNREEIKWSNNQSVANECRHACSHLRYYPFECLKCEKVGRYHKKCDMSEITRHIKDSHSMLLKTNNFESLVKSVKIRKLESFIEFGFKHKNKSDLKTGYISAVVSKPSRTVSFNNKTKLEIKGVFPESRPKRAKLETQTVVANNHHFKNDNTVKVNDSKSITVCSDKNNTVFSINKKPNNCKNNEKIENSEQKTAKVEIKFMPIKTYSNTSMNSTTKPKQNNLISGDQIIIKRSTNDNPKAIEIKCAQKPVTPLSNILSQQFKDMMEDESMDITNTTDANIEYKNVEYFCIFCTEKLLSKENAYQHYQNHVDYYPIICLTCGERLTDLQSFLTHHRETHPEAVKGRYKKKEQPNIDKWITSFLYSQATIVKAFPPREQCTVCEQVFTREEVDANRPRRCTINRRIDHMYRHLCYLPYECLLCRKESGPEFFVAYFESKAHSHIKQKHPEIDDNESRWDVFQKTIFIPKLDEFIENYLSQFGISLQFERRPVKKSKQLSPQEKSNTNSLNPIDLNESSYNLNMIFSDNIDSAKVLEMNHNIRDNHKKGFDTSMDDNNDVSINECNNNSNDSDIVVNVSPHILFDKSVTFNTEEDSYFCIFCPAINLSKTDAYSHYGEHLEYFPVICRICGSKFSNVDHLMTHHQSIHSSQTIVDYEISEDQVLMKWVNEFLESQLDYRKAVNRKVMPCSCSYNCPVCVKLMANEMTNSYMPCAEHNDVSFSVHIHQHLNYFPYECSICKRSGKSVRVPNLDLLAMNHIREHKIESASMVQLCKNFPKTLVIPKLEKMIGDSVHRKRVSEKQNKLVTNPLQAELTTSSSPLNNDLISEQLTASSSHTVCTKVLIKKC